MLDAWPAVKKRIISQEPGMYTLNLMEIKPGSEPDQLILSSNSKIYIKQLEDDGARKLRLIEQVIMDETGAKVHIRTQDTSAAPAPEMDLTDITSLIHGPVDILD